MTILLSRLDSSYIKGEEDIVKYIRMENFGEIVEEIMDVINETERG